MKCTICGAETGKSWKRYCYPHWKQYVAPNKARTRRRAPLSPSLPNVSHTSVNSRAAAARKPGRFADIVGAVFGWAILLGIFGGPVGFAVYDNLESSDDANSATAIPSYDSQPAFEYAPNPTRTPQPTNSLPISWPFQTTAPQFGATSYTVQSGDSWWAIAEKFGVTLDSLLIANGHNYATDPLYAGDILVIPSSGFNPVFIPYQGNGGGPTLCRDGTYSHSSGRGTCSHHGGIAR